MAKPKSKTPVIVSVSDEYLPRIHEVAQRLRAAGMDIGEVMESIGTISGSAEAASVDKLSRVEGVNAAEVARQFQIPPPDADVQ
jgi:hypothetical protein